MTKFTIIAAAAVAALSTQVSAQQPVPAPAPAPAQPQPNLRGNWLQADQTRQQQGSWIESPSPHGLLQFSLTSLIKGVDSTIPSG